MRMRVMQIGEMRVAVLQRLVPMTVGMRLRRQDTGLVLMPVVIVMVVKVLVFDGLVAMPMLVTLCKVQPDAQTHERRGHDEPRG